MKKIVISSIAAFALVSSSFTLQSCSVDDFNQKQTIKKPEEYSRKDIQSYGDLFKVFWTVMDQRYNYFLENKRPDGLDWDGVRKKYYPQFLELKSFGGGEGVTDGDMQADAKKAKQLFEEIVNPIIDRHFQISIKFPYTKDGVITTVTFSGGMSDPKPNYYSYGPKARYMLNQLSDKGLFQNSRWGSIFLLSGYLKSAPDIYYLTFESFSLTQNVKIELANKYFAPDTTSELYLTAQDIENSSELKAIKDTKEREKAKNFILNVYNEWLNFFQSDDVKKFNEEAARFNATEVVSDELVDLSRKLKVASSSLVEYSSDSTYKPIANNDTFDFIDWFIQRMTYNVQSAYQFDKFSRAIKRILTVRGFYTQFLNPLHEGKIKKLIIDVRGNGGGNVVDSRFFGDRFITKNTIWGYQRSKVGNGQYNYTPWVPARTSTHPFGIPASIPIAILTDKGSYSMSELTTMMLKSQGPQVISVGDYSAGATAGLGNPDDFNGGTREEVAFFLDFYMPLLAMKDANGEIVEGIGVKPDILVSPPTDEELRQMETSPDTFEDRVIKAAVDYLSSK